MNDIASDVFNHALKTKGKWWANIIFYNKEVDEYFNELWKETKTLDGALKLSNKIKNN